MADNTTFAKYQESGFNEASGVSGLKEQTSQIPVSESGLRQQAIDQYADTLNRLDESYSRQIANLITAQATDEKLLNEQYNNSITSMMAKLQKRGLNMTASLPQAQTDALNKHKNDVTTMRQNIYQLQREVPEKKKGLLTTEYEKAINQRVAANRAVNVPTLTELLAQISELQNASYGAYIDYLNAKKSGGGSRRKRTSGSSSATSSTSSGYVNPNTLSGNSGAKYVDIYENMAWYNKMNR